MTDVLLVAGKLNNRQKATRLGKIPPSDNPILTTLTLAENIDIDNNGEVSIRDGRELVLAGSPHSFWVHPQDDQIGYFVENSVLKKLNTDLTATTVTTLNSNSRLDYELVNSEIVVSNGVDLGWLKETTYDPFSPPVLEQFEVATPAGQYIALHKGCLYVLKGSILYVTKPHKIEVMDSRYCTFPMAGYGRMLGAVEDGVWIATEKEVGFIHGKSVDGLEYEHITDSVPADGCFEMITEEGEEEVESFILWASPEGFCKGTSGAKYTNKSFKDCTLPGGEYGSFFTRFNNGIRQYIAVIHKPDMERNYTAPDLNTNEVVI